jgi:hypothetical protein
MACPGFCQAQCGYILCRVKAKKPARKTVKKPDGARAKLEKDLRAAIAEIDEQGLLFLLRQAQVLIHNRRLERMAGHPPNESAAPNVPKSPPAGLSDTVIIEDAGEGNAIFLTIGRARKVLTTDEMKRLVRICYAAESKSEALRRLFTVLVKERKDILADAVIGGPDSALLEKLFSAVRTKYRLEDR